MRGEQLFESGAWCLILHAHYKFEKGQLQSWNGEVIDRQEIDNSVLGALHLFLGLKKVF